MVTRAPLVCTTCRVIHANSETKIKRIVWQQEVTSTSKSLLPPVFLKAIELASEKCACLFLAYTTLPIVAHGFSL